jgi:hypothetical protein
MSPRVLEKFPHQSTTSPSGNLKLSSSILLAVIILLHTTSVHTYLVPKDSSLHDRPHISSAPLATCRKDTSAAPLRRVPGPSSALYATLTSALALDHDLPEAMGGDRAWVPEC